MESERRKVEVIKEAIKQVMEEGDVDDERLLLSKLMSQLEDESEEEEEEEEEEDRILKEMKKVRRQNVITQCLVSVMIIVTVAWQISEVSIILKLKHGLTHPFRSLGTLLKARLTRPPALQHQDAGDDDAQPSIDSDDLKIQLPKIGLLPPPPPFNHQH